MLHKLGFLFINTIAPSAGSFIYSSKNGFYKFFCFFLLMLGIVFFIPLLPINWAFFAALLIWPIIFFVNFFLCFGIKGSSQFSIKKAAFIFAFIFFTTWGAYILCFQKGRVRLIRTISHSMSPSFEHGEIVLVEHYPFSLPPLERGDVVIYEHPNQEGMQLIKRVVGLEKDAIKSSRLLIKSNRYRESLVKALDSKALLISNGTRPYKLNFAREVHPAEEIKNTLVPKGHFFAIGDNRLRSVDSRSYGSVHLDKILGIGKFIIFSKRKNIYFGLPLN